MYDYVLNLDGSDQSLKALGYLTRVEKSSVLVTIINRNTMDQDTKSKIKRSVEFFDVDALCFTPKKSVVRCVSSVDSDALITFDKLLDRALIHVAASIYGISSTIVSIETVKEYEDVENNLKELVLPEESFEELLSSFQAEFSQKPIALFNLYSELKGVCEDVSLRLTGKDEKEINKVLLDFEQIEFDEDNCLDGPVWLGFDKRGDVTAKAINDADCRSHVYSHLSVSEYSSGFGSAQFGDILDYCVRCCMPTTAEALQVDDMGMCQPCRASEQKMEIDWVDRERDLDALLAKIRAANNGSYDCMIPVSGGKDSTFQTFVLTGKYKSRVLATTFCQNLLTPTGRKNLENLITRFDIDHLMLVPRRSVVWKLAKESLNKIGDACWHCHSGVGAFPLKVAVGLKIKLLVWGESLAENDGRATYDEPLPFDRDYFTKVSARFFAEDFIGNNISYSDVAPYVLPSYEEVNNVGISGIHLGDYIFWDDERQMEFVRDKFGWSEGFVEGTYKGYKSVECIWAGVHDYAKFVKRGYGRATDHASQDVRAGLLTRQQGFELAKAFDGKVPVALEHYLDKTGYSLRDWYKILEAQREGLAKKLPSLDADND